MLGSKILNRVCCYRVVAMQEKRSSLKWMKWLALEAFWGLNKAGLSHLKNASAAAATAGPNCKNPPKIKSKKFVKLMDHTCTCNNLTSFKCKTHPRETETVVNLLKFNWKNLWNHIKWNYFMAGFKYLEPQCSSNSNSSKLTAAN